MSQTWTRERLLKSISLYQDAIDACSTGKSYTIGSRTLTRYDLKELWDQLEHFEKKLAALDGKRSPFFVHGKYRRP